MLGLYIGYMTIMLIVCIATFIIDGMAVNGMTATSVWIKRYLAPIQMLLYIFYLGILELLIKEAFSAYTDGFVNIHIAVFGIIAALYLIDYALRELKMRNYVHIQFNGDLNKALEISDVKERVTVKNRSVYAVRGEIDAVNQALSDNGFEKKINKKWWVKHSIVLAVEVVMLIVGALCLEGLLVF